jgi:hypothetical protein
MTNIAMAALENGPYKYLIYVDLPNLKIVKDGDFPVRYVSHYQRVD